MIRLIKLLTISLLTNCAFSFMVSATHTVGGGFTWEQIGKDTFKITLEVIRDCNSMGIGQGNIQATTTCGTKSLSVNASKRIDITPICSNGCSGCSTGSCSFKFGLEKYLLTTILVVSDWRKNSCCTVDLSWAQCCRSQTITTGPQSSLFVIDARMNICDTINNNSPIWRNEVATNLCLGRDFNYDLGANARNPNDSVVYSFTAPKTNYGRNVSWTALYDYYKPLYFLGFPKNTLQEPRGFHLDTNTGQIMFRPMKVEFSIMKIQAEVYRNGVLHSVIAREQPIIVTKCPDNNPPVLSGLNCTTPTYQTEEINLCFGAENCIEICVSDNDKKDSIELVYDTNFPGAVITVSDSTKPTLTFCANVDSSLIGRDGFYLSVLTKDQACPIRAFSSKYYKININARLAYQINTDIDGCGDAKLSISNYDSSQINCIQWTSNGISHNLCQPNLHDSDAFNYKTPGKKAFVLKIEASNGCNYIDSATLNIPKTNTYLNVVHDTFACANDSMLLKSELVNANGTTSWSWNSTFTNKGNSTKKNIKLGSNDSVVFISYKDSFCSSDDTIFINVNSLQKLSFNTSINQCFAQRDTFKFIHTVDNNDNKNINYTWSDSIGNKLSSTSKPAFYFPKSGKYIFTAENGIGCQKTDTINYTLHNRLEDFYIIDSLLCHNTEDTLRANNLKKGSIKWYLDPPAFLREITPSGPTIGLRINDSLQIGMRYEHYKTGCKATKIIWAYSVAPEKPKFKIEDEKCANDTFKVSTHLAQAIWTFEKTEKANPLLVTPMAFGYYKNKMSISFSGIDTNQCLVEDEVQLQILKTPISKIFVQDTILTNETFYPKPSIEQGLSTDFFWEFGDPIFLTSSQYQPTLSLDTVGEFRVQLTVTDQDNNCSTTTIRNKDLVVGWPTSIVKPKNVGLSIYPNPTNNQLIINAPNQRVLRCTVLDVLGQEVAVFENTYKINLEEQTKGTYIVIIKTNKTSFTTHVLKN